MKKLALLVTMLVMLLLATSPAMAETVTVGNLVAGEPADNLTVAGTFPPSVPNPFANLPLGADVAAAGNPVPPNVFAQGLNAPLDFNEALGGVGPVQNDVVAMSDFFGGDFAQAGIGSLSADTEN